MKRDLKMFSAHGLRALLAVLALAGISVAQAQTVPGSATQFVPPAEKADPNAIGVEAINKSEQVLCAEKDNIQIDFVSPQVRNFRVQAVHPAYIAALPHEANSGDIYALSDNWKPRHHEA